MRDRITKEDNPLLLVATKLMRLGSVLTMDHRKKKAWLDYWVPFDRRPQEIPFEYGQALIDMGFVDMESGNLETGERHYLFSLRPKVRIVRKKPDQHQ